MFLAAAVVGFVLNDDHDHNDVEERSIYIGLTDWIEGYSTGQINMITQRNRGV